MFNGPIAVNSLVECETADSEEDNNKHFHENLQNLLEISNKRECV